MTDSSERPPRPTIIVSQKDLETAFRVWLKTIPTRLWRDYEKMLAIDSKRLRPEDRVDPRDVVAEYMARKFAQANWTASYPQPGQPFNPTPWGKD